jgi:hypothetical protein
MSESLHGRVRAAFAVVAVLCAAPAAATVVGFEDLDPGVPATAPLAAGYAGFGWQNLSYVARPPGPPRPMPCVWTGTVGLVSAVSAVGGTGLPLPAVVTRADRFAFLGATITSVDSWWKQVDVEGWRGGQRVYAQTVDVTSSLAAFSFDFVDVDEVRIAPREGKIALDELQLDAPDRVPPAIELVGVPTGPVDADGTSFAGHVSDAGGVAGLAGTVAVGEFAAPFSVDPSGWFQLWVPLAEGPNTVVVTVVDAAGNPGSVAFEVVRDATPPSLEVQSPASGAVVGSATLAFVARVQDATPVTVSVEVLAPDGDLGPFPATLAGGLATAELVLPGEGEFTVRVTAVDALGHASVALVDVRCDLTGPAASVDVASGARFGPLPGDVLTFHATVVDAFATTLTAPFTAPIALPGGGGVVPLAVPLVEGTNEIALTVADAGGRTRTTTLAVLYDTTPPTAALVSPADGATVRGAVDAEVVASDATTGVASVTFSVDGGAPVGATGSGTYGATIDLGALPEGEHVVAARVVDGVGNVAAPQVRLIVDLTAPAVAVDGPAAGSLVRGVVAVSARAEDATSGVRSLELRASGALVALCEGASCAGTVDTTRLPDGPFEVAAIAVDRAGNVSQATRLPLVADNKAPARFIVGPAPGAVVAGSLQLALDVVDAAFASVECHVGDLALGPSSDPRFTRSIDLAPFLDGPLAISCTALDAAGNVGTETVVVTVRNWALAISPTVLQLRSGSQQPVTVTVEGQTVGLLAAIAPRGLFLVVPGGSPAPLDPRSQAPVVRDGDRDGIPDLALGFQRQALASSISGGIATGALPASGPIPVTLVTADGRALGSTTIEVR